MPKELPTPQQENTPEEQTGVTSNSPERSPFGTYSPLPLAVLKERAQLLKKILAQLDETQKVDQELLRREFTI